MKKTILSLILIFSVSLFLQSCQTQKGYNYSNHQKHSNSMHRKTQRVNKGGNQLNHKSTPHR